MLYQRIHLSDQTNVGSPADLPSELIGLPDDVLADLPAALDPAAIEQLGYQDTGFMPVPPAPPPPNRIVSQLEFIQRIPLAKRVAIMQAAGSPDYTIQALLQTINAAIHGVDLDDPDTVAGLNYAQSINLLTADDVAAIRA